MSVQQQQALDSLYAIDNVLTIKITMPQSDWDAVRTEQPAGGVCNFEWTGGSRFTWRKATSVEISGTQLSRADHVHRGGRQEEIILRLTQQRKAVPAHRLRQVQRGQRPCDQCPDRVALSDAQQFHPRSIVYSTAAGLQIAGYGRTAHSRCNFARVFVNGTLIGQGLGGVNSPGTYVNAEPIMKRYIERNFNGNMDGNLYELEHNDDFVG